LYNKEILRTAVLLLINDGCVKYRKDIPETGSTSESTVGADKVGVKKGDKMSRGWGGGNY
jgi:hypothetical protein